MRKVSVAFLVAALFMPGSAIAAHGPSVPRAKTLIRRAVGPGTVVSDCHAHDGGLLCRFVTPTQNMSIETDDSNAVWMSYAVVVRGRVRVA